MDREGTRVKEVTGSYNPTELEERVQGYWHTHETFRQVLQRHACDRPFFFVDGPPYTTGHIHLGTAWNKIIKDSLLRFYRMTGRNVIARAGYDMHGLPIEVQVEQKLGFVSKKDIEQFGIERFIEECRSFAETNRDVMSAQFKKLGVWMDFDNPYQTLKPSYIEAAWWALQQADKRGMLEVGHRVVNWCPRCETAIADAEVEYWDEHDPSVFVKFPVTGKEHEYLVIWTTTPWTLPANVAVAVHPDLVYARVRALRDGVEEVLWIAEELVKPVLKKGRYQDFSIISTQKGTELVGLSYTSPLAEQVPVQSTIEHRVVTADYVAKENTGLVHIAPGHGWDDFLVGVREKLAMLCPVDGTGRFTPEAGVFAGLPVREANSTVLEALGDHLLADHEVVHRYGHCWRCKTPIIFRATEQWFLKIVQVKEQMLEEIREISWYPDWAGSARFADWVREARDWCISRQRYWGIPIPVWQCSSCRTRRVIGTIHELEEAGGVPVPDPHRPYVDKITIPCECGGTMHRVKDIFDVWFDSAVASWATLNFPAEHDWFDRLWPADLIAEGQDQTRGWFYSQLGASTCAFNKAPYKRVLMHGFALDADGRKMSKSLGNVITPEEVVAKYGVDVLRFYVLSANAPWDDLKFNWDGVKTVHRTINVLWNVYRFPLTYMSLDRFVPESTDGLWNGEYVTRRYAGMPSEDRWIISTVNSLAVAVTRELKECTLHKATRGILSFILEDLSRWYVQLVRPRMWLEGEDQSKQDAYETMYYVMRNLLVLIAPFAPHIAETCYQNLKLQKDAESVHMLDWIGGEPGLIDRDLEEATAIVRSFDDGVANARQAGKRKLRWPVAECVVVTTSETVAAAIEANNQICRSRANSRVVTVARGRWDRIGWQAEPVMKKIGPAYGRNGPLVKGLIEQADVTWLKGELEAGREVVLTDTTGNTYTITSAEVTFREHLPADVFTAPMQDATVYVDVTLSPELEGEGYGREVTRRLQEMRRQAGLKVEDMITAEVTIADQRIVDLIQPWTSRIRDDVRATALMIHAGSFREVPWQASQTWEVEEVSMTMGLSKAED